MLKLASLVLAAATAVSAAEWDGTVGTLTVSTVTSDLSLVSLSVPEFRYITFISVKSSDPAVNNIRVSIKYRDEYGNLKSDARDADAPPYGLGWITVIFPLKASQIVGTPRIEARCIAISAVLQ